MTPADIARVLAKCAAFDQRTVGAADVAAWHEALHDVDFDDAMAAVTLHYRDDEQRIKPVHIRRLATELVRQRRKAEREAREQAEAAIAAIERGHTEDRSAEVTDLVARIRQRMNPGDPDALRRSEWTELERRRERERRPDAGPNPHFKQMPPPGGWPVPGEEPA